MAGMASRGSVVAFAAAAGALAAIKLLFDLYPGDFPVRGQAEAFTWPIVAGIALIGLLGFLADRALSRGGDFPEPFSDRARDRRGLLLALVTGAIYGLATAAWDFVEPGGRNPLNQAEWAHVPWPWSLPFYTFGAIFLEFLLRLGALCILVWVIHVLLLRRRALMPVFWTVNAFVAAYEIMPMVLADAGAGRWASVAASPLEPLYWTNLFEGWLLLRYGWVSPILFRLAFYLVWHILYGGLGPF